MIVANRFADSILFGQNFYSQARTILALIAVALLPGRAALAEPITHITLDGIFSDWVGVPAYFDAVGGTNHTGTSIPDVHDTDHDGIGAIPNAVYHPDVDILEYKFTHDAQNLYAYFRATGTIGRTQEDPPKAGRYYVIVTIDVDNNDTTGYWLHEGGYFPTSDGYDMNMEAEFYDGQLNTAHYLSHDALTETDLTQDFIDLTSGEYPANQPGPYTPGFVQPAPGNYDNYTQWVYHDNDTLTLVEDKGPIVPGIMSVALSADGHEIEIAAPYKGFLGDSQGIANVALGSVLDISFSLEASGELWGGDWASDTGDPIVDYFVDTIPGDFNFDGVVDGNDLTDPVDGWQTRFGADLAGGDFLIWQRQVGNSAAMMATSTGVPEPASFLLWVSLTTILALGPRGHRG
jgi:hypothetical protein